MNNKYSGINKICEIDPRNYDSFVNVSRLKDEFKVENIEINNDSGIIGAIYNRLNLKDLK